MGLDLEETEDRSLNGCLVRNVVSGSAAEKDKRLKEGDFVIAVNNESLKGASTAQAKAILRRASLLGGWCNGAWRTRLTNIFRVAQLFYNGFGNEGTCLRLTTQK